MPNGITTAVLVTVAVAAASAAAVWWWHTSPSFTPVPAVPTVPVQKCVRIKSYADSPKGFICDPKSLLDSDCTVQCCPAFSSSF